MHSSASNQSTLLAASAAEANAPLTLLASLQDVDLLVEEKQIPAELGVDQSKSFPEGSKWEFWKVFGSTFVTIFLAELGDKTQVSILLMSAEFHTPWVVFAGAATALITTSLLGVLLGRWLSTRLSAKTLDTAAGIMLALIAVWLLWDVVQM